MMLLQRILAKLKPAPPVKEWTRQPGNISLISVHIPKTAGTSFRRILKNEYGNERVARIDAPLGKGSTSRKEPILRVNEVRREDCTIPARLEVIHGHFNIEQLGTMIELPPTAKRITWLRDPVERVISNYYYLRERLRAELNEAQKGLNILSKMQRSLIEYARAEKNRNRQSKFLAGTPLEDFDFVGIQEHYAEDVAALAKALAWTHEVNIPQYNHTSNKPKVGQEIRDEIASLNAEDVALYERGLALRAARTGKPKLELVSLHIPKTGGTSFYETLRRVYGPDVGIAWRRSHLARMTKRYGGILESLNGNIRVLHGHFYYPEIELLHRNSAAKIICWLRDPVERVASNYHFFRSNLVGPVRNKRNYELNKHRKDETLLEYAALAETQNRMSKFLAGIELDRLDFIGFQDRYEEDLTRLAELFDWSEVASFSLNVGTQGDPRKPYDLTPTERERILEWNAADVELYRKARQLRGLV